MSVSHKNELHGPFGFIGVIIPDLGISDLGLTS